MTVPGQTETSARRWDMSVSPPIADLDRLHAQVRSGPQTEVASLFNHHIGADEQCRGYGEAKCLCRFQIENEIKTGRLFYW